MFSTSDDAGFRSFTRKLGSWDVQKLLRDATCDKNESLCRGDRRGLLSKHPSRIECVGPQFVDTTVGSVLLTHSRTPPYRGLINKFQPQTECQV